MSVLILTPATLGFKAHFLFLGCSKHPVFFHLPFLGEGCRRGGRLLSAVRILGFLALQCLQQARKRQASWAHRSGLRTRPPGPASALSLTREGRRGGLLLASPTQSLPSRSVSRPTLDSGTNAFGDYTSTVLRCVAEYFTFYVLRKMTSKKK